MAKKITLILIVIAITVGVFSPVFSDVVHAQNEPPAGECGWTDMACFVRTLSTTIAEFLLKIGAIVLAISGSIFNSVISFTIENFAKHINNEAGLGGAISNAWSTLRDIGNIVFIFVLLWAALQLILGLGDNIGKTIRNIIIVGLLVNFSLFFTKVVIDASNIAAVGFYNSIMAGAGSGETIKIAGIAIDARDFAGIFMRYTGVQSFFGAEILDGAKEDIWGARPLIVGIMGMITMLILAIVLLIAGVMFLARFLILIFLMILSPVALIAFILPALKGKFNEWWDALISQAFFAPFFMLLIWIAFRVMAGMRGSIDISGKSFADVASKPLDAVGLFFNFIVVIGLIIMALVLSKQLAMKTKYFGAISGGITGGVGVAGRNFVGRPSRWLMESKTLRRLSQKSGLGGTLARGTSWAAYRGAKASYDPRGIQDTKLGKATGAKVLFEGLGKAGGEGGVIKSRKDFLKDRDKAKLAEAEARYGVSESDKNKAENAENKRSEKERGHINAVEDEINRVERELRRSQRELEDVRRSKDYPNKEADLRTAEQAAAVAQRRRDEVVIHKRYSIETQKIKEEANKFGKVAEEIRKDVKETARIRQYSHAERLSKSILSGVRGNKSAAQKVREEAKGESDEKKIAKAAIKAARQQQEEEGGPTPETPAPAGGGGGAPAGGGTTT